MNWTPTAKGNGTLNDNREKSGYHTNNLQCIRPYNGFQELKFLQSQILKLNKKKMNKIVII